MAFKADVHNEMFQYGWYVDIVQLLLLEAKIAK